MTQKINHWNSKIARIILIIAAFIVLSVWLISTPGGVLGKLDGIGYAVCHRIDERSFHIGERALPLCARCSGMYLGAMTALAYLFLAGGKKQNFPSWSIAASLILFVIAFGLDGANSYLYLIKTIAPDAVAKIDNLYIPNNTLRILTGSGMGLGLAAILHPAFNQSAWMTAEEKPALTWKGMLILVPTIIAIDLLVITENPIVLYPAAFISTAGVLILLTMVYTVVWIMITGQENTFTSLRQMWLPLVAGFTIALLQILAIDLVRYWLTGTWGSMLPVY